MNDKIDFEKNKIRQLEDQLKEVSLKLNQLQGELGHKDVDWSEVPIDTQVLVRESPQDEWMPRYFAGHGNKAFVYGYTSRAEKGSSTWKYMKLDPDAKSIINWIDNPGYCPEHVLGKTIMAVLTESKKGDISVYSNIDKMKANWFIVNDDNYVIKYAIIEEQ